MMSENCVVDNVLADLVSLAEVDSAPAKLTDVSNLGYDSMGFFPAFSGRSKGMSDLNRVSQLNAYIEEFKKVRMGANFTLDELKQYMRDAKSQEGLQRDIKRPKVAKKDVNPYRTSGRPEMRISA